MNVRTIAAPALLLGFVLAATPAFAERSTDDRKAPSPVHRPPVNVQSCALSRSCAPGPYITVIIDKNHTKIRRSKQGPSFPSRRR